MDNSELLMAEAYDEGVVSEVIRPAAIVPEEAARAVLVELALRDVQNGGRLAVRAAAVEPVRPALARLRQPGGRRADRHHPGRLRHPDQVRDHHLPGHGHPVRRGPRLDRHSLTDAALDFGGLTLDDCPRATIIRSPRPFKY